ncbi:MAG: hypothetical protein U5J95_03190 [Balneolaceae bacterium]|nr:hypothetical protein [Balneolaceae bacterium]
MSQKATLTRAIKAGTSISGLITVTGAAPDCIPDNMMATATAFKNGINYNDLTDNNQPEV